MKNALVVNPYAADFKLYDEWMHPLGLYLLISSLTHASWNISFFNCLSRTAGAKDKRYGTGDFCHVELPKPPVYRNLQRKYKLYGRPADELRSFLGACPAPDVIFCGTGMTYWIDGLQATIDILREFFPRAPLVMGGNSAILVPDILRRRFPDAHIVSRPIFSGTDMQAAGIPFLSDPPHDTRPPSLAEGAALISNPAHGPVLLTQGCPYACTYCASSVLQPGFQARPIELVMQEIRAWYERGARDFAFYDDALLYQADRGLLPLLRSLLAEGIKARFHVPNGMHVRWVTPDIADRMFQAGFVTLRFGYESGSGEFSRDTCGKTGRAMVRDTVSVLLKSGFSASQIGIYIMGGLPGQTARQMRGEIEFIASLGVRPKPVFLSPVPRTRLFDSYLSSHPEIGTDALWHNDAFFVTRLPGWGDQAMEELKLLAKEKISITLDAADNPAPSA